MEFRDHRLICARFSCSGLGSKAGQFHSRTHDKMSTAPASDIASAESVRPPLFEFSSNVQQWDSLDCCYRGGPRMRSLISIDFPALEMEPESAHVSAVSIPGSNVAIRDAAPPRQHSPILRYSVNSINQ